MCGDALKSVPMKASSSPAAVAWAGLLALALAMGIGRFAFTPLLPLMQRDGLIDAALGAELAAANYGGYLLGALSAAAVAARLGASGDSARRSLRLAGLALLAVVLLTAAMALSHGAWTWRLLRAGAGVASAWALVGTSGWALGRLAQTGQAALGGRVFAGVGSGIALAGLAAWMAAEWASPGLWALLAALGAGLALAMALLVQRAGAAPAAVAAAMPGPAAHRQRPGLPAGSAALLFCYGAFGFGYIVPATYLPLMARQLVDDPRWFGLAWPLFGLAAALSTLASARWAAHWPRTRLWALCQAAMALGVALPLASRSGLAIAAAAVLVGGSFMVATMAGLQLARAWLPADPTPLLARLTAAFALGQIAGPLAVRGLAALPAPPTLPTLPIGLDAIALTSAAAALLLAATAAWLWLGLNDHPPETHHAP